MAKRQGPTGTRGGQAVVIRKALSEHFALLEQGKAGIPGIAARLAGFVMDGENEGALQELTGHRHLPGFVYYGGPKRRFAEGLSKLLKLMPEDPDFYLRLAAVYNAASMEMFSPPYSPIPGFQTSLRWLYIFLAELSDAGPKNGKYFPANLVAAMLDAKKEDPSVLIRGAMIAEDQQGKNLLRRWGPAPYTYFRCLSGFPEIVARFPEIVHEALRQSDAGARAYALAAISALEIPISPYVEEVASLVVSGSKEVREKAGHIVEGAFASFQPLLERCAVTGSSDERYHAVRLLGKLGGGGVRDFLTLRLETEKSTKVVEALKGLLSGTSGVAGLEVKDASDEFGLQPVADIPVRAPLDKQVLVDLPNCLNEFERRAAEEFARNTWAQQHHQTRTPVSADTADSLFEALQDFVVEDRKTWNFIGRAHWGGAGKVLWSFASHSSFQLIHVVRWSLLLLGRAEKADVEQWRRWLFNREIFLGYQKARKKPADLRELAAALRAIGLDDRIIGRQIFRETHWSPSPFLLSDPNAIWPYFAERLDLLEEVLGLRQPAEPPPMFPREKDVRQNAFAILKLFPRMPAKFVPLLWDIALGSAKTERSPAQECLDKYPSKEEKIVAALASRQQDARLAATEWLAKLKYQAAVPALRAALTKEKSEPIKDEMVRALETFGVRLEEILDLDKLDQEAEKGLKKGIPSDLDWFPFGQLPPVRWSDSGAQVPAAIVQWFLVQGCRLHNAEANPTLRRYCSLFQKDDREKLGRFVLDAWIAKDTKPKYSPEKADALAQQEAAQAEASAKMYPQYYPDFDKQKHYNAAFQRLLIQPEGSQNSTKGILALAGACCGGDAAPIVHRYVKQWYGYRGAQCKALLQVLAWIEHPSATQVVLAVANRFRTKGIQEEAMRLCQMLAERRGWTLNELADRTIPTCGLDEDGVLELDYGSRKFVARLSEEMTLALTNQNGKTIASLPDANQSDDAEKVKQAKARLSAARKELKSVLSLQKDRLYEALCTQRAWRFGDWETYLARHPIVGRYCQRLVWATHEGIRLTGSFRPLADGSLTDHQDEEVRLEQSATIRLAHEQTLSAEDRSAWVQHLSDYKVEPLFPQFGKQTFTLPAALKQETSITEFLGHVLKAFSLRNRLTRLGYTRGAAQDGGWFVDYHKNFASLGIEAVIEFTGNGLPEQDRKVALQRLYFARKKPDEPTEIPEEVPLGEIPPVLLAECWNDIRAAAADGSGFAEDWQKQTEL